MKHLLKSVFMKVESPYGTSSNPTAAEVMLCENVDINPLSMTVDDHAPVSSRFGQRDKILGATWCTVNFDIVTGAGGTPVGALGGVPSYDAVLRAGAMSRSITPAERIIYSPIDSGEESATIRYHVDTGNFLLLGVRGDLEWIFEAGKATRLRFTGLGLRVPMLDGASAAYSLPVRPRPLAMNNANTLVRLNETYSLKVQSMNIKLGNKITYVNRSSQEEVLLEDRLSSGSITFELPSVAEQNFLGAAGFCTALTQVSLWIAMSVGQPAGNRIGWYMPKVQLLNPRLSGNKGTSMLTCDIHIVDNLLTKEFW